MQRRKEAQQEAKRQAEIAQEAAQREQRAKEAQIQQEQARQKEAEREKHAAKYAAFLQQNSEKIMDIVKQSYHPSYPKNEKYPPIGKAFDKFFNKPTWEFSISPYGWKITFKGIAHSGGQNARLAFVFTGASEITPEALDNKEVSFTLELASVNGEEPNITLAKALAAIFLN